jgi:hypothetical protein
MSAILDPEIFMRSSFLIAAVFALVACGQQEPVPTAPTCELSLDGLAGKSFVMLEALDRTTDEENPMARLKFVEEDGKLIAKYTAKSVSGIYDYECVNKGKEIFCGEEARWQDYCQALEAHEEGSCTAEALRKFADGGSDEELEKAIKDAKEVVAKFRGGDKWDHFVMNNNNLGNKLRGQLYAKVDTRNCRLTIDDMYFTIYNGKKIEDYNPVGKNAFVSTDQEWLFEACDESASVLDWDTAEKPKIDDITPPNEGRRLHKPGAEVHYFYYGEKENKAVEGCTYSGDIWANWKPVKQGVEITPGEKGELDWHVTHAFAEEDLVSHMGAQAGIFHMTRHKECEGKKERIDAICYAGKFDTP